MSDTYYVKTFGGLKITNDNVTVILSNYLESS